MREVVNKRQLEYLIQRVLRELSEKYDIDIGTLTEVISSYCEILEENVRTLIVVSEN